MQIIHIAENSTTNNVLLAIATFKYRIYCNVLSFTIYQPCSGSHDVFFYICCTCWYDEDYDGKLSGGDDNDDDDKDIFASPYIIVFLMNFILPNAYFIEQVDL